MARYGVISDVHRNYEALVTVVRQLRNELDSIVCLGDVVDVYFPEDVEASVRCLDFLEENDIPCVVGNHDWIPSDVQSAPDEAIERELGSISRRLQCMSSRIEFSVGYFTHQVAVELNGRLHDASSLARKIPPELRDLYPSRAEIIRAVFDKAHFRVVVVGHQHTAGYICSDGSKEALTAGGSTRLDLGSNHYVVNPGPVDRSLTQGQGTAGFGILDVEQELFMVDVVPV